MYSINNFIELINEFDYKERELLRWKGEEYSDDGQDRLQNFREIAAFTGLRMSEVALIYMLKHVQSIKRAVKTGDYDWGWQTEEGEGLKQRIADLRNYCLLIAACLDEEAKAKGECWVNGL